MECGMAKVGKAALPHSQSNIFCLDLFYGFMNRRISTLSSEAARSTAGSEDYMETECVFERSKQHLLPCCVHHNKLEHPQHSMKNRAHVKPNLKQMHQAPPGFPADFRLPRKPGQPCHQEARQSADHIWPGPPFAAERSGLGGLRLGHQTLQTP